MTRMRRVIARMVLVGAAAAFALPSTSAAQAPLSAPLRTGPNGLKVGDVIEAYRIEQVQRTL